MKLRYAIFLLALAAWGVFMYKDGVVYQTIKDKAALYVPSGGPPQKETPVKSATVTAPENPKEPAPAGVEKLAAVPDAQPGPESPQGAVRFISVNFQSGGHIEGRVVKQTASGGYVLAIPGGQFTVEAAEIAGIQELPADSPAVTLLQDGGGSVTPTPPASVPGTSGQFRWYVSLDDARREAVRSKKIIMLVISTTWCHWCRELENNTLKDAAVREALARDFVCAHVDGDRAKDIVRQFSVTGFPAVRFLRADDTVLDAVNGYLPPRDFLGTLTRIAARDKNS